MSATKRMDEAEWRDCTDPQALLEFLSGKASDRKLRLLGVAFCRRIWKLIPAGPCREAVRVAERCADGFATDKERRDVHNQTAHCPDSARLAVVNAQCAVHYLNEKTAGKYPFFVTGVGAIAHAASDKYRSRKKSFPIYRAAYRAAERAEARLVRCVFGNPFRPVRLDPTWLARGGDSLRALAETLYEKRRLPGGTFDPCRVGELADALEDAGCSNETILSHLRGPGPHVRGCWVVDLLLGKV